MFSEAGTVSVEKNSAIKKELAAGKYVAAVLMKGGTVVAYSMRFRCFGDRDGKAVLIVNGNVYEGDTKVSLAGEKNGF